MAPTLLPGDRLLVDPGAFRRAAPRVGDLVVVRDPESPRGLLVKRVAALAPGGAAAPGGPRLVLLGDDRERSRDSRHFGPVPVDRVVGRPYYRTGPPGRAGPL